ncbi:Sister chromatid cohesion protein pds5 [Microbotryomycetes sp. JL201]|nr:Sister chromatid cohesion protein pds5 [Microbotryomycetes sp. JL201]
MARPSGPQSPSQQQAQRLQFKHSFTGCTHADLLKRLRALHEELAEMDQDLVVTESLDTVAKDLIKHSLLLHREQGIRAYLACCLADVLRLYAPDAPYNEREIKDIFEFFIRQLKYLADPNDPHFSENFYLIESLSNVKSIVLICDLDGADELMRDVFKHCFDVLNSKSPKNVEICLADLLMQILEEAGTISPDVVEILIAQFLPAAVQSRRPAHRLAVDVCTGASDKLQRYVCQYFAEQITSHLQGSKEDDVIDDDDSSDDGAKRNKKVNELKVPAALETAHELIRSINRSVPALLTNVIPQLEEELGAENVAYRKLAADKLGQMFGEKVGQGDLAAKYPQTWRSWLDRVRDKSPAVRMAVVQSFRQILTEHPELSREVEPALNKSVNDLDDHVRFAACQVFEKLDYETASNHIRRSVLELLAERILDKKFVVRNLVCKSLGRLYSLAYNEIESREEHALKQFGWIPGRVLNSVLSVTEPPHRYTVTATFLDYITPLPLEKDCDEASWVDRLLCVMRGLDDVQRRALLALTNLTEKRPNVYDGLINFSEYNNGGVIDKNAEFIKQRLAAAIQTISTHSPDATKTSSDLNKFAKANEKQLYKLLRTLMDAQSDLPAILKTLPQITRRVAAISPNLVETMKFVVRKSAYLFVNRSSIPMLLKRLHTKSGANVEAAAICAAQVLEWISTHKPVMYKMHVAELTVAISATNERMAKVALRALSKLIRADPTVKIDKKLAEKAYVFAKTGTPDQAKHAATIVALDKSRPTTAADLVEYLNDKLMSADEDSLVRLLSALNRMARYNVERFETRSESITTTCLDILTRPASSEETKNADDSWTDDNDLPALTRARALVVKMFTNRCIAYAATDSAQQAAEPVFQLVWPLLQPVEDDSNYTAATSAYLRLTASFAIMKLAAANHKSPHPTAAIVQSSIAKRFELFARTAQDECFEVRSGFVDRLLSYLRAGRLPPARFSMVLFLVAHDPESEIKLAVQNYIRLTAASLPETDRQAVYEHPFVRLIHLLAHHPDFEGDEHDKEEISSMSKYIEMYLDLLATERNVSYLWHLAQIMKTIQDRTVPECNTNLYILSELAQHLIKQKAKAHSWAIQSLPPSAVPKLPSDIFKPVADKTLVKQVINTTYLEDQMLPEVTFKHSTNKIVKVKSAVPAKRKSPKAKQTSASRRRSSSGFKKAKKRNNTGYDSDENESVDSDDDDDIRSGDEDDQVKVNDVSDSEDDDGDAKGPRKKTSNGADSPRTTGNVGTRKGLRSTRANGQSVKSGDGKENDAAAVTSSKLVRGLKAPRPIRVMNPDRVGGGASDEGQEMDQD